MSVIASAVYSVYLRVSGTLGSSYCISSSLLIRSFSYQLLIVMTCAIIFYLFRVLIAVSLLLHHLYMESVSKVEYPLDAKFTSLLTAAVVSCPLLVICAIQNSQWVLGKAFFCQINILIVSLILTLSCFVTAAL